VNADDFLQPSDEEVLAYESRDGGSGEFEDDGSDDDEVVNSRSQVRLRGRNDSFADDDEDAQENQDDFTGWGSKKDYYNADVIETEQDALEEEGEANRLQQKQLQSMTEADYGFDQDEWLDSTAGKTEDAEDEVVREILPQLDITEDMPEEERLKIMRTRYPEFEPLAKDFVALQPIHEDLRLAAAAAEAVVAHVHSPIHSPIHSPKATRLNIDAQVPMQTPVAVIKFQALSAYLGAIGMYLVLFTSTSRDSTKPVLSMPATELRDHPIMDSLVRCRKTWEQVRDMIVPDVADIAAEAEPELLAMPVNDGTTIVNGTSACKNLSENHVKRKKTKSQRAAEAAQAEALAREEERRRKTEEGLADLSNLLAPGSLRKSKSQSSKKRHQDGGDSDFGDEITMTAHEAAEKAKKKKSLRFYTSQIAQKANKRDAAGRNAGGDDDLPYRERLKDRQARLNAEAEKRGKKAAEEAEELGGDSDEGDRMIARELRGEENDDEEDYYDMVAAHSKQRKSDKKALADAYAEATTAGGRVEMQEEIGPGGKRKITYAIEKNKGLTPKRKKDVRNPRVKKRKKFEEKKKKLGSIRAVYKGGEGRGGYGGELTGIKKNLVKSVKL
jgi:U3 small nucleolar RNA-associated protein 3